MNNVGVPFVTCVICGKDETNPPPHDVAKKAFGRLKTLLAFMMPPSATERALYVRNVRFQHPNHPGAGVCHACYGAVASIAGDVMIGMCEERIEREKRK